MSRSNPTDEIRNPATRFFQWDGDKGGFKYYDKEKEENVKVSFPFAFLVLDTLVTLKGYNEPEKKSYWSNEVRNSNIKNGIFVVKTKSGVEMEGTYQQCKEKLGTKGLDYVQSVYIMWRPNKGEEYRIANLQLKGAAIGPWIDILKKTKVYETVYVVKGAKAAKKGKIEYFEPVFEYMEMSNISPESADKAVELDKELQVYLESYFSRNGQPTEKEKQSFEVNKQERPLSNNEVAPAPSPKTEESAPAFNLNDEDFSDIPF